jgi:hypothetical protein
MLDSNGGSIATTDVWQSKGGEQIPKVIFASVAEVAMARMAATSCGGDVDNAMTGARGIFIQCDL